MRTNYIDEIADTVREFAGDTYNDYAGIELFRNYAVLVLSKGTETTMPDVHNAWAAWALTFRPQTRNIIPFEQLTPEYQNQDRAYVEAIHDAARYFAREREAGE